MTTDVEQYEFSAEELQEFLGDDYMDGMEDFDPNADMTTPRLSMVGESTADKNTAAFVDSLSGEEYPNSIDCVILGMVRQRTLWPYPSGDEPRPICRATEVPLELGKSGGGLPTEDFPWEASGLKAADYEPGDLLPCYDCALKEWGTSPNPERPDTPWCTEQFVVPIAMDVGDDPENPTWAAWLMTFQRTSLGPARKYIGSFYQKRRPTSSAITRISLAQETYMRNVYPVPRFKNVGKVGTLEQVRELNELYKAIRERITINRGADTVEPPEKVEAKRGAAASTAPPIDDDDDIPFEEND